MKSLETENCSGVGPFFPFFVVIMWTLILAKMTSLY